MFKEKWPAVKPTVLLKREEERQTGCWVWGERVRSKERQTGKEKEGRGEDLWKPLYCENLILAFNKRPKQ